MMRGGDREDARDEMTLRWWQGCAKLTSRDSVLRLALIMKDCQLSDDIDS